MANRFQGVHSQLRDPATRAAAVTPSDTADLGYISRALYVGAAGNLVVILAEDAASVTFVGVQAGSLMPLRVRRVLATGTTAGSIVAIE